MSSSTIPSMMTTIGYAQFEPKLGDLEGNLEIIRRLSAQAPRGGLLVFPELATSGYDFVDGDQARSLAEPFDDGLTARLLSELARERDSTIVLGYPERAPEGLYNAAMIALPDGRRFNYRKLHLFSREKLYFVPGDAPPPVIDTPAGRVGIMICFDWIFPETARLLALGGAQIIAHPSNLVLQYCQRAMYCRSVENRVYSVTANRTGTEDQAGRTLTFTGASQVVSPGGDYLIQAPDTGEHVGMVEVALDLADNKAITEHNDLWRDRRTELYAGLVEKIRGE